MKKELTFSEFAEIAESLDKRVYTGWEEDDFDDRQYIQFNGVSFYDDGSVWNVHLTAKEMLALLKILIKMEKAE